MIVRLCLFVCTLAKVTQNKKQQLPCRFTLNLIVGGSGNLT